MTDECNTCGVGFYLPSGVCDHCDTARERADVKLKDILTGPERMELVNIMRNEPVPSKETISIQAARSLQKRGLVRVTAKGWVAEWKNIEKGEHKDA